MISRRIARKPENDNYRRLANYIADAGGKGEKCLLTWCAGCWAGDDYDLAIQEVADTQDLSTRTTKEKTYHLIVSFRPEDEAKLTPAVLKGIETELAKALGFEEHQRHCGVHKNTANLHMHLAYNMIHPERLTRHEPYRDYHTRDRACREMEKRFDLVVDNGREQAKLREARQGFDGEAGSPDCLPLGDAAATVEAHTGQVSFESYAKGFRESILARIDAEAANWQSLHQALARHGLVIKPLGNGLVIQDRHGKHRVKASSLDRSLSKGALEKRFGRFQPAGTAIDAVRSLYRYQAMPIHRQSPERDKLFAEYLAGIAERRKAFATLQEERAFRREAIGRTWRLRRAEIDKMVLTKRDRYSLLKQASASEAKARRQVGQEMNAKLGKLSEAFPCSSWSSFLRWQAEQGNETALAVLRSRRETIAPERGEVSFNEISGRRDLAWTTWNELKRAILDEPVLAQNEKHTLLTVAQMHHLEAQDAIRGGSTQDIRNFTFKVDSKGTVLFTLASGGLVCDMGDQVYFSARDPASRHAGLRLARMKWGNTIIIKENRVQSFDVGLYNLANGVEY